ncbi:MAG TPA: glycyl-radical enzyme activating protein [Desulfosporosinus sp.]|nr:glycyl-radical enzyme activating protein [Desulfosporosinus sp.]
MTRTTTQKEATVFNIQKYTVHDGPGIRTAIFFKGCPMHCLWCSNPESMKAYPQVAVFKKDCISLDKCGRCLHTCPYQDEQILQVENGYVVGIDRKKCRNCLLCAQACPNSTLKIFGKKYTVRELMNIIMEDRTFYRDSNGGVTVGGGDPLMQYEFIRDLFTECKRYGVHTCLETELQCKREAVEAVLPYTDLWITDIKVMDPNKHQQYTGMTNERILENIKFAVDCGAKLIIRTPVVPGYNNDEENIHATARFVSEQLKNKIVQYQLLPYRLLGTEKYEALQIPYPMGDIKQPPREEYEPNIRHLVKLMVAYGVPAVAGSSVKYDY